MNVILTQCYIQLPRVLHQVDVAEVEPVRMPCTSTSAQFRGLVQGAVIFSEGGPCAHLAGGQHFEDLVLDLLQLLLVLRAADDELVLLLLKVGTLLGHHNAQQLVLQTLRGIGKGGSGLKRLKLAETLQ